MTPKELKKTVAWFSAGVSSAVATKLAISQIDEIIYTHIDDQHPDTMRFIKDCEQWFGKAVTIMQSPFKTVQEVCLRFRYINGVRGARCSQELKKMLRIRWEYEQQIDIKIRYVWGMDYREKNRASRIVDTMPEQEHIFPLIDRLLSKEQAHEILSASGIKRPVMYDLGYNNNNCIGCVKGGQGYWNHIRKDFPKVFESRAKMEREIKASCINGIYLDELDPDVGRLDPPILGECGILCEAIKL